ncbi:MAG: hypothetical protein LQ350_007837 [Teloschistes chrysophthalmus]|nr:MAG: hypothetical protein LQ350_007837 [Niorma chrysophthalma]
MHTPTTPSTMQGDEVSLNKYYIPIDSYEGRHRYDPKATWTKEEEQSLIRKLDIRVCAYCCLMFFALQIDRSNITQALSDNFPTDLGMNTNDYNTGGFIPDVILYLSYFYKSKELPIRLSFFWGAYGCTYIISAFLAFGILHLRGHEGLAGWQWLFALEGSLTALIGIVSW